MISFTAEEFESQTFPCKDGSIIFQDKSFVEGPSFSQHHYAKAVNYCKQYAKSGIFCLLQEGAFYFTVWLQKLEAEESKLLASAQTNNSSASRWFKYSSSTQRKPYPQVSDENVDREEEEKQKIELKSPQLKVQDTEFDETLNALIDRHFGEKTSSEILELKSPPEEELPKPEIKYKEFDETLNLLIEHHFGEQDTSEARKYRGVDYEAQNTKFDEDKIVQKPPQIIRYRGVEYEVQEEQVDVSSDESSSEKSPRKYRGKSY